MFKAVVHTFKNLLYYYIIAIFVIFIDNNILDVQNSIDIYDYMKVSIFGDESTLFDAYNVITSSMPSCVVNIDYNVEDGDGIFIIKYLNYHSNKDILERIIELISSDYKDLKFDVLFYNPANHKIKCFLNLIYASFVVLVLKFINNTDIRFDKNTENGLRFFGIIVAFIFAIVTIIFIEYKTQIITLAINPTGRSVILNRKVITSSLYLFGTYLFEFLSYLIIKRIG